MKLRGVGWFAIGIGPLRSLLTWSEGWKHKQQPQGFPSGTAPGVPGTCCGERRWSLTRSWRQRCHHLGWSGPACPAHSGTWLGEHRRMEGQGHQLSLPSPIHQGPNSQSPHQGQNVPSCQHLQLLPIMPANKECSRVLTRLKHEGETHFFLLAQQCLCGC